MEKISLVMFNPQPEPPGVQTIASVLDIFDRIASFGFTPQPEPPGMYKDIIGVWSIIAKLLCDQEATPAAIALTAEMLNVIDLMSTITMSAPVSK